MKKILLALLLAFSVMGSGVSAQKVTTLYSGYNGAAFSFVADDVTVGTAVADNHSYNTLSFPTASPSSLVGRPNLPTVTEIVEVPLCQSVSVTLSDVQTRAIRNLKYPVMPVQPAPSKSDQGPRPFVIDNAFYADSVCQYSVQVSDMGVARDRKVATLSIQPFTYNPATGELEQIVSATITLTYKGTDVAATESMHARYYCPDFALGHRVLGTLPASKAVRDAAPLHYLIVAHSSFRGQFDSFVNWKKRQGFIVTVAYTDDNGVGTTNTAIASYIKSFYTNATDELPAPTYLLLIGDHQQIPAFNARCTSPDASHVTDLYFATWTDGDHLPDCYYGRFSARTVAELTPQVEKTIYYEGYNFADDSYLGKGILISGVDGGYSSDNAYRYADPAMDYIAKYYVNASCGYNDVRYYKNNTSFAPTGVTVTGSSQTTASATALRTLYSQGYGWINYSAHGDDNKWHEPEFTTTHVAAMSNANKPSIMIGNCCLTGRFNTTTYDACLGEALLRRANNAGAVAYFGGTNSTYWPHDFCWSVGVRSSISNTMDATYDANNLGMYDRLFHTHGENHSAWHTTTGSMVTAGNNTVEAYGSYQLYYWEIYELFGDPSLMPWLGQANVMDYTAADNIPVGSSTYAVSAAPYAYVALTTMDDHNFIAAAYADANGNAALQLPSDLTPGQYELAIWAQNYQPVFAPVNVIVLDGPYASIVNIAPSTQAKPNEVSTFDITLTNIGTQNIAGGSILFTAVDGATVVNPNAYFGAIAMGDTITLTGVCATLFHAGLADGAVARLNAQVFFGGSDPSSRNVSVAIHASQLSASVTRVAPTLASGTTSTVTIDVANLGSLATDALSFTLVNDYGFVATQAPAVAVSSIVPGGSETLSFTLTMGSNVPETTLPFNLVATDAQGSVQVIPVQIRCGAADLEDFETGNFTAFSWNNTTNPWEATTSQPYAGTYCARSKTNLNNNSSSNLTISWTSAVDDSISFYYKVSSESGYDEFIFSIDGEEMLTESGEVAWTRAVFAVPAGTHTFKFAYEKDYSYTSGSDCAWIDNVSFPFTGALCQFATDTVCQNTEYTFRGQTVATSQIGTTVQTVTEGNVQYYLSLAVMPEPEVTIQVSEYNGCMLLRASGASSYVWSTGETTDFIVVCPTEATTYSVTGTRGGCSSDATTTLLGIDDVTAQPNVTLYPNPAHNIVVVNAQGMRSVQLINLMGQTLQRQQVTNSGSVVISLDNIPCGVYFVKVDTAAGSVVRKLVRN